MEEARIIKKRNRPSVVCILCKTKKIKCDRGKPCTQCVKNGTETQCSYDERVSTSKPRKRKRAANSISSELIESELNPDGKSSNDICVLIPKHELEQLQTSIKKYELSLGLPEPHQSVSTTITNNSNTNSISTRNSTSDPSSVSSSTHPEEDDDMVYNRSVSSYRKAIFSYHDEQRPGYIPLENVMYDKVEKLESLDLGLSVTNRIRLSDLPKAEHYLIGINPYANTGDIIDLDKNIVHGRYFSALSWSYVVKNSQTLSVLKSYASNQKKEIIGTAAIPPPCPIRKDMIPADDEMKSTLNLDDAQQSHFQQKVRETDDDDEVLPYDVKQSMHLTTADLSNVNVPSFTLGLTILGSPRDRELNLLEQIEAAMPTKRVISLLTTRFFRFLYPFFPYIDEHDFREQTSRILGPESHEEVKAKVNIQKRLDFAHIGLLFIILRLSYLSLFYNRSYHNEQILKKEQLTPEEAEKKTLFLNPININTIDISRECLHHFQRLGNVAFPVLQCLLYLRLYRSYAPEEGDGLDGSESQISGSILISMCYSLGLNREPDKYNIHLNERTKNLYRKIWFHIVASEYMNAYFYGAPLLIRDECFDTNRPSFKPGNSNIEDVELEKSCHAVFAFGTALMKGPINDVIKLFLKKGEPIKVMELTNHLNHAEQGVTKIMGKVGDYVNSLESDDQPYHTHKIMKATILIRLNMLFVVNYCILFNYYEKKSPRLGYFYLKKLMAISFEEVLPFLLALIVKTSELFGEGADLYINPTIIQAINRIFDVALVAIVRTNFSLFTMSGNREHRSRLKHDHEYRRIFDAANRFILCMEKCCRICLGGASILSSRYYFAWGVLKSKNYFLKLVSSPQFYKDNADCGLDFYQPSSQELNELADIIDCGLSNVEDSVTKYCTDIDWPSLFKKQDSTEPIKPEPMSRPVSNVSQLSDYSSSGFHTPDSAHGLFFSGFEDLKFDNSSEIDSLWLQMLSSKNNQANDIPNVMYSNPAIYKYSDAVSVEPSEMQPPQPSPQPQQVAKEASPKKDPLSYNEMNFTYPLPHQIFESFVRGQNDANEMYLDFFDDLPLDQVFEKRKRPSLVCSSCKKKKIKCDKQLPCNNCIKSKCAESCAYDKTKDQTDGHDYAYSRSLPYVSSAKNPIILNDRKVKKPKVTESIPEFTPSRTGSDQVTVSLSELNMLKARLQQIESSINVAPVPYKKAQTPSVLPPPIISSSWSSATPQPQDSLPTQGQSQVFSTNYNISNTRSQSPQNGGIQLPPLNLKSPSLDYQVPGIQQSRLQYQQQQQQQPQFHQSNSLPQFGFPSYQSDNSNRPSVGPSPGGAPNPGSYTSVSTVGSSEQQTYTPSDTGTSPNYPSTGPITGTSLIGYNPYLNPDDTINFYENYTSIYVKEPHRRVNFGPFSWSSMMRRDRALSILWDYVSKSKEKDSSQTLVFAEVSHEVTQENNEVVAGESNEGDASFRKRALEADGYADLIPYKNILKKRTADAIEKAKLNKSTLPLGLTFYEGQIEKELQLIDKIQFILPKKKVVWKLIDRFFAWLYPFMPFLDEIDFRASVAAIIGPESFEDVQIKEVKIEKRLDLALIGTLLLVLRLAYLSLFSNKTSVNEERLNTTDPSETAQDVKYLLQNPISINTADVAYCCLAQFEILRKTSFPVLQLAFYLRLYHTYAPEDGDGADGGDSQTLTAVLTQMAYSLGLHRDPDNFTDILNEKRQNHLGRKIWHYLVLADVHNAYSFGSASTIDYNSYDTKIPFHEEGNENLRDKTLDRFITACFFPSYTNLQTILDKIIKLVLNVRGKTKLEELCKLLSEFEVLMAQKYGSLEDCMNPPTKDTHIFVRNFPTKFYISLKAFCVSIFFHIFIHYEPIDLDLSFFYLKKIIKIACTDLMPHYFELLGNSEVICDMMINPKLEQIIHKLNQVNLAMIVRVNFTLYYLKSRKDHEIKCTSDQSYFAYYTELCKLSSCLTRCAEFSIAAVSKLSTRYYYAWRITKGHTYLLKTVTTLDFYKDGLKNSPGNGLPAYSTGQIKELVSMCEGTLSKLGKVCMMGSEFCTDVSYKQYKRAPSTNSLDTATSRTSDSATTPSTLATNPSISNGNKSYTNEFGLNLENSSEIDNLWLQMLTMKQETSGFPPPESRRASINLSAAATPGKFPTDFDSKFPGTPGFPGGFGNGGGGATNGFPMGQDVSLDMFGDLPFSQMFDRDYML
ncbi:Multidrug resistance regulator 1 [Spathaspora sp. JA1]|nr:Multidrug resistance regulator 1 [Spathaspora sp. JA1]